MKIWWHLSELKWYGFRIWITIGEFSYHIKFAVHIDRRFEKMKIIPKIVNIDEL